MRVGLTLLPHLDTRGIKVRLRSGEILFDTREERRRMNERVCQEDTGVKGIPFEMGCLLTPVSLM